MFPAKTTHVATWQNAGSLPSFPRDELYYDRDLLHVTHDRSRAQ